MAASPEFQAYVCIGSDSLSTSDGNISRAMAYARSDIEEIVDSSYTAVFTASPNAESGPEASSAWQCQQPPEPSLLALQDCKLWVLFTDGDHGDSDIDNFASQAQLLSVHKYPCVMVLFGACAAVPPPSTKYQVYQDIYSQATDALLLFHDIHTQQIFIFQAKGCFASLAEGTITVDSPEEEWTMSAWFQLCRFRYAQLDDIQLPAPDPMIHLDQLTVDKGGAVITIRDYLARMAAKDIGDKLDHDRLKEIIAAAKSSHIPDVGLSAVAKRRNTHENEVERVDFGDKAYHAIQMIFFNEDLRNRGIDVPTERLEAYRADLRVANETNRTCLHERFAQVTQGSIHEKLEGRRSFHLPVPDLEETFVPGFVRSSPAQRQHGEYRGTCQLCHAKDSLLVLLLHTVDGDIDDQEKLKSLYLSEIFNPLLVCDACAFHFPSPNNLLLDEVVVSTLPLVSIIDNEGAWTTSLGAALSWSFATDDPLLTFTAWFRDQRSTFGEIETEEMDDLIGEGTFRGALSWVRRNLEKWMDITRARRELGKSQAVAIDL